VKHATSRKAVPLRGMMRPIPIPVGLSLCEDVSWRVPHVTVEPTDEVVFSVRRRHPETN
jgi:hypothetical protein